MGQHKYNKTAAAAKAGLIPPKDRPIGKRELENAISTAFFEAMSSKLWPYQHQILGLFWEMHRLNGRR